MVGGGKRADAQAYEMIIDTDSIGPGGFTGRYRTAKAQELDSPFMEVNYVAPGIYDQELSLVIRKGYHLVRH
jgi:hypothetical protein